MLYSSSSSRTMDLEYLFMDPHLREDKSDTFSRIMCKIKSQYPSSKYSLSSNSDHDSSKYHSNSSSSKSYDHSSKYPSHFSSSSKSYDNSSKYPSHSSSSKSYDDSSKYYSHSSFSKSYHDSSKYYSYRSSPTSSLWYHSSSTSTKSLIPLIETYHNEQNEKSCDMPIYNSYSDNDYDDDDYYIPMRPKIPPGPMLVL